MAEKPKKLGESELRAAIAALDGWKLVDGKLSRTYRFRDFVEAWGFMSAAALRIQEMDHHPEWMNVYDTVRIQLVTHDAGGITQRDVDLAHKLETLAAHLRR